MTDEAIKKLSELAMSAAVAAAKTFMEKHGLVASNEALAMAIQQELTAAIPEALDDARDAFQAGMVEVADQTFRASMVLAGIRAAKRATRDPQGNNGDPA